MATAPAPVRLAAPDPMFFGERKRIVELAAGGQVSRLTS
jgi:hypothetical protein